MAADEDWSTNAGDALVIRLKHRAGGEVVFHPPYTYSIFGDEETVFGYRDLTIKLDFDADTLYPTCDIDFAEQYPAEGDTKADDVELALRPFIPAVHAPAAKEVRDVLDSQPFLPPGEKLRQYTVNGREFGIWSANLLEPKVKEMVRRVQVLVPLFIEGGTEIDLDHPDWTIQRWNVFFLYEIINASSTPTYNLAGYCTTYQLFYLDTAEGLSPSNLSDFPSPVSLTSILPQRQRISQFLILPPFRSGGHGSRLYATIFKHYHADSRVSEITVEDPNELFDDLRDINDLLWLRTNASLLFTAITLNPNVSIPDRRLPFPGDQILDGSLVKRVHAASKIADRQFDRLLEMQLLSQIPAEKRLPGRLVRKEKSSDENDRKYYFWRTMVKKRLYKHNRDTLIQLDAEDRVVKLEQTMAAVQEDYVRLLGLMSKREKQAAAEQAEETNGAERRKLAKKRVVDDDDDDDDDGDMDQDEEPISKRARLAS